AAGHEGIDASAARARGIPVCNAPGTNVDAVAQATMLLVLALARRWPRAQSSLARASIGVPVGIELVGRTLLVVGLGRIGARVAASRARPRRRSAASPTSARTTSRRLSAAAS